MPRPPLRPAPWLLLLAGSLVATAAGGNEGADETHGAHAMAAGDHAMHGKPAGDRRYERVQADYTVPPVTLTDTRGAAVRLDALLDGREPVVLNFIFTSCNTICPILSATFERARDQLGGAASAARWVSITIDPEHDTPQVLASYAREYNASANWEFLTGDPETIVAVQRAFGVFRGDKMSHEAVTLLRGADGGRWVRLEGVTSGAELAREYRQLARP